MNKWTNSQRRWRKKSKRGVSPIIATILLVAITVVLAAVLYILISGLTKGPGNTPIGTSLAMGTPNEATAGTNHYYNFTIESAGAGIIWNDVNVQVKTSSGTIVSGLTYTVTSITGTTVVSSATGITWTSGAAGSGSTQISSTQTFVVTAPASLSGNTLYLIGTGSFSGTIPISIP